MVFGRVLQTKKNNTMKEIANYKYKNHNVQISVSERGKFYAKVPTLEIRSHNNNDGDDGFSTIEEVKKKIEEKINLFLETKIDTYEKLAQEITSKLTWTDYEDCYLDTIILKNIMQQVILPLK